MRAHEFAARASIALALIALLGCDPKPIARDPTGAPIATEAPPADPSKVVMFALRDLRGADVSTDTVHGRTTVLAFLTSYDPTSLAEARFLIDLEHRHAPRINVVFLMLERPENQPLVQAFSDMLATPFPVCMADADTIAGRGVFAGMNSVPSVLVLDKEGHEHSRHLGFQKEKELEDAVSAAE
jgi:hypothetical protein